MTEASHAMDPDRFRHKLAEWIADNPAESADSLAAQIFDSLAYTYEIDGSSFAAGVRELLDGLAGPSSLLRLRNCWLGPAPYLRGVVTGWRDQRSGQPFEVQLHTPESLAARDATREIHAQLCEPGTTPAQRLQLDGLLRRVFAEVPVPDSIDALGEVGAAGHPVGTGTGTYAIIRTGTSGDAITGLVRRRDLDGGFVDESFRTDLTWRFSTAIAAHARGELGYRLRPIAPTDAEAIIARWRQPPPTTTEQP